MREGSRPLLVMVMAIFTMSAVAGQVGSGSVFLIGHSLVNHDMPQMLAALADDAGISYSGGRQIINGANLQYQWYNSHDAQGTDAREALPTGDWDVLVMTEAVPLDNHLTWSDTHTYAAQFHDLAIAANPDTRSFVYETWHCINSGLAGGCDYDDNDDVLWRERLDQDLPKWQGIADYLNANSAGPEVRLVPAGQAMGLLHDRAEAGQVPGISQAFDLYSDDIHLTDAGNYFVALVMFASIFQTSPEGLTYDISNQWGSAYDLPDAPTAQVMQAIAWEVAQGFLMADDSIFASRFE